MKFFASLLQQAYTLEGRTSGFNILDIGGTLNYWRMNARYIPNHLISSIEIVNLPPAPETEETIDGIHCISYEGNALNRDSLRSSHYDVIHSNSVIEHVGNLASQKCFADNVRSLGEYHYVQTPCKWFPIEPHVYFPFFAFLPLSIRGFLLHHFNLGHMPKDPNWLSARIKCEDIRLLTRKELQYLFPDASCFPEKFYLMVKSWMVSNLPEVRNPQEPN